jgi:hypothetical protein
LAEDPGKIGVQFGLLRAWWRRWWISFVMLEIETVHETSELLFPYWCFSFHCFYYLWELRILNDINWLVCRRVRESFGDPLHKITAFLEQLNVRWLGKVQYKCRCLEYEHNDGSLCLMLF